MGKCLLSLCIETRENDPHVSAIVDTLNHAETRMVVLAERAFLSRLEGGCQVPIAAFGQMEKEKIILTGLVADIEGKAVIRESLTASCTMVEQIGVDLAEKMLEMGAGEILEKLQRNEEENHER